MNKENLLNVIEEVKQTINILKEQLNNDDVGCDVEMQIKSEKIKLESLEKQVAKKPTKLYKSHIDENIYGECPNCGHTGLKQYTHEHCWWCGQKIDWE